MTRSAFALSFFVPTLFAGCMVGEPSLSSDDYLTFEEFKSLTFKEPWEGGHYIVNGDTPIIDDKALHEFWQAVYEPGSALIVNTSGGVDTKWTDTQKLNLTYCISNNFGSNKDKVIQAFQAATDNGWEVRGNVNFIYVPAQDANCTASNNNVVFDVRPVNVNGQYLARAFFPNNGRSSRNVLIDNSAFNPNLSWPLANIVAHELGHALGFRHEHTRPESGACFEDNNWRPLTAYDRGSVMHYPQCNGLSSSLLDFTQRDADGVAALYGPPGGNPPPPPPPPPPGDERTQTYSGTLPQNRSSVVQQTPSLSVVPGSTLTVVMSGSGDPDLYVRFGSQPTTSQYNCRPYLNGANETCTLTVPSNANTAYIGVVGYTASSFNITATYTAPTGGGGGQQTQTYSGSVVQNRNTVVQQNPSLTVVPGTTLSVVMTGSGDPDLYVRFGSQPTTSQYNCRPYLNGASESCSLTVPSGATTAHIGVVGYTAATFNITANYTAP